MPCTAQPALLSRARCRGYLFGLADSTVVHGILSTGAKICAGVLGQELGEQSFSWEA